MIGVAGMPQASAYPVRALARRLRVGSKWAGAFGTMAPSWFLAAAQQ